MSGMTNAFNHLRRFWSGKVDQKQLAAELGVSIALANKFAKHNKPEDLPKITDLPIDINNVINETDFRITVRGHHTKCWIWNKSKFVVKDPVTNKVKDVNEVIYRIYAGKEIPKNKVILNRCNQEKCINYDHFCIIPKNLIMIFDQIKNRRKAEINKSEKNTIANLSKKYNFTEKEQALIFHVDIRQIK